MRLALQIGSDLASKSDQSVKCVRAGSGDRIKFRWDDSAEFSAVGWCSRSLMQTPNLVETKHGEKRRTLVIEECLFVLSPARMLNVFFQAETSGTDRGPIMAIRSGCPWC